MLSFAVIFLREATVISGTEPPECTLGSNSHLRES